MVANFTYAFSTIGSLALWLEFSPMVRETWVQSQVASYQRPEKRYLIPPCLKLSNIRYVSRIKWSNPREGVVSCPTPRCSSYWKGSLRVVLDYSRQPYLLYMLLSISSEFTLLQVLLGNVWTPFSLPSLGLNRTTNVFWQGYLWH